MNRRTAAWVSLALIILQMVTGPVAHPMSDPGGAAGCDPTTMSAMQHVDDHCVNCPTHDDGAPSRAHHDHPGPLGHARCACPCGSTPALTFWSLPLMQRSPPADVAAEIRGPAFAPPLFDFLRPPN